MKDLMKNNPSMKILSVVLGVLIWFLVSSSNDPLVTKRYTNIKVNMINGEKLTESGMTYNVESGETVDIAVKGNRSILNHISKSDFTAEADLSQLTQWGTTSIQVTCSKYSDQLDISLGSRQVVTVHVEEIFAKSVKVMINPVGDPAQDYVIGTTSSSPSLVDVTGAKSKVEKISGITVNLDVTDASEAVKEKIRSEDYILYDEDGEEISQDMLTFAQKSITAKAQILKKKEIAVHLEATGQPKEGFSLAALEYEPKKIVIAGKEKDIDQITSIELEPISVEGLNKDYSDEIELTADLLRDKTGYDVQLYDDSVQAVSVKAVIEKTISRNLKFKDSDIEIRNNDENYVVTFSKDNDYKLTVRGPQSVVNHIRIEDFKPYINLESIRLSEDEDSAEFNMNFHYTEPDNVYVTAGPDGNIKITVSK